MTLRKRRLKRTPSKKPKVLAALIGVGLAAALVLISVDFGDALPWASRYPELCDGDEELIGRIREALEGERSLWEILERLEKRGEDDPFVLLEVLLESHWEADGPKDAFLQELQFAGWLERRASPALDDVLLRMARDTDVSDALRTSAAVALCRKGYDRVVEPLAAIVCDRGEDADLRMSILGYLPAIGAPLSGHLEALLWFPLNSEDHRTAIAIASSGESLPPTLLRDALREGWAECLTLRRFVPLGILALARNDAPLRARITALLPPCDPDDRARVRILAGRLPDSGPIGGVGETAGRLFATDGPFSPPRGERATAAHLALADAIDDWISRHPAESPSPLEQARATYRESERFRRERTVDTLEEILAADEADLDLAACALALEPVPDEQREAYRDVNLDRLMRITHVLREEIAGKTQPEEIIAILERRLLRSRRDVLEYPFHRGADVQNRALWGVEHPHSRLGCVLRYGAGHCIGNALLYLAVAERLDLPIRAVQVPGHLFVRWDDGEASHIIETNAGCRWRSDESCRIDDGRVEAREGLGTKQVLSLFLTDLANEALEYPDEDDEDLGRVTYERADAAIRLDPENSLAHRCRARARLLLDPRDLEAAIADLDTAVALQPAFVNAHLDAARLHVERDARKEALASFETVLGLAPDHDPAMRERIEVLLALGRIGEALVAIERKLEEQPNRWAYLRLRFLAGAHLRETDWLRPLPELERHRAAEPGLRLDTASVLLQSRDGNPADPALALTILDQVPRLDWWKARAKPDKDYVSVYGADKKYRYSITLKRKHELQRRYFGLRIAALQALARPAEAEEARRRLGEIPED